MNIRRRSELPRAKVIGSLENEAAVEPGEMWDIMKSLRKWIAGLLKKGATTTILTTEIG